MDEVYEYELRPRESEVRLVHPDIRENIIRTTLKKYGRRTVRITLI